MNETVEFKTLGICDDLIETLQDRGINHPTTIQHLAIPSILQGKTVVAKSQTGSGKSLAYILPLVQLLSANSGCEALILTPTRELAQQVSAECRRMCDMEVATIYGGVEYQTQIEDFARSPRIVVATPGRLQDLIERGVAKFEKLCYFTLDEVDLMCDMGFRDVILQLAALRHEGAQTLCFSATLPEGVKEVLRSIVGEYSLIEDRSQPLAAQSIVQSGYYVEQSLMDQLLLHLIRSSKTRRAIVFCRSRKMADTLNKRLLDAEMRSEVIHGERSQAAREYILSRFAGGETETLVATDLVARGIDIEGVTHIFNFGLPQNPEQYIHRIGRTGRAGGHGEAISLICPDEAKLLGATCAMMRQPIPMSTTHPYMTPAVTLALNGGGAKGKKSRR